MCEVIIRDDGPGFAPDVLARLGEPYVTTRRRNSKPVRRGRRYGPWAVYRQDAAGAFWRRDENATAPAGGAMVT